MCEIGIAGNDHICRVLQELISSHSDLLSGTSHNGTNLSCPATNWQAHSRTHVQKLDHCSRQTKTPDDEMGIREIEGESERVRE